MEHDPERWRDGQTPTRRGPWFSVEAWIRAQGFTARIWKDIELSKTEAVEVWGLPPLPSLLMRRDGQRIGQLHRDPPEDLKEKGR